MNKPGGGYPNGNLSVSDVANKTYFGVEPREGGGRGGGGNY